MSFELIKLYKIFSIIKLFKILKKSITIENTKMYK